MDTITLHATPLKAARLRDLPTEVHVLLRLVAPDRPAELPARAPLDLALVVDRSGSMSGQPLREAIRAAQEAVRALGPDDRVCVVAFDHRVAVPVEPSPARPEGPILTALSALEARGRTDLEAGWRAARDRLAALDAPPAGAPSRDAQIVLLSDGRANVGVIDPVTLGAAAGAAADAGVCTTTLGLGQDFDEDLLTEIADLGRGRAYYGETAEDLRDPLREELGLLDHRLTRGLRLRVEGPPGVELTVLNRLIQDGDGQWRLPDLAYDGEAWAMVRLRAPACGEDGGAPLLRATATWQTSEGEPAQCSAALDLPCLPAEAYADVAPDPLVEARQDELRAAELQDGMRAAARKGDWPQVEALLERAKTESAGNPWVQAVLASLERMARQRDRVRFSKSSRYASHKMRRRLADKGEAAGAWGAEAKASYLRRKEEMGKGDRDDET